jgi:hypothetical protein
MGEMTIRIPTSGVTQDSAGIDGRHRMALIADTCELITFRCDGAHDGKACGATHTGKPHELKQLGWHRELLKRKRELLLCDDCAKRFAAIWKERKAA